MRVVVKAVAKRGSKSTMASVLAMGQHWMFISMPKNGPSAAPEYMCVAEEDIFLFIPPCGCNFII